MAIKRLNFTGRKRINRKDVRIAVHEQSNGSITFDADLRLKGYRLPDDALVFVEAYRQTLWMRFPYGHVGSLVPPGDDARKLTEFDSADGILFRVKVTSSAGRHGILLAEADMIPAGRPEETDEDRSPLLPVCPAELGSEVYRVDFSSRPVLLINKALSDWRAVACSPVFRSLVCPSALRAILTRIRHIEDYPPDLEDREDWRTRWLVFASALPGVGGAPADHDEAAFDDWIDVAVSSFASQQRLLDHFTSFWDREEQR